MNRTRARSCIGKRRHDNREAAQGQITRLIHAGHAYPGQMTTYRCKHCQGWHVGHAGRSTGRRR